MTRVHAHQPTFARGEIHPSLSGRVDLQLFHAALARCREMVPMSEGIVRRRGGTRYIGDAKNTNVETRLIPFIYSEDDGYAMEMTEFAIRFWRDNGQVESAPSTPVEVTTTYSAAQVPLVDYAQSADVMFMAQADHHPKALSRTSHTSWTFGDYDLTAGPFQKENTTAATMDISGATDAAVDATVTATASVATFVDAMVGGELALTIQDSDDVAKWLGNTHADPNSTDPAASLYKSTIGDRVRAFGNVYEAKNSRLIGPNPPDHSEGEQDAGDNRTTWIFIHDGFGRGLIDSVVSPTQATLTVTHTIPEEIVSNGTKRFRLPEWSDDRGWPQAVALYDDRLLWANTKTKPQTIWASVLDDFGNMQDGTDADLAITKTMTATNNRVNPILSLVGDDVLVLMTPGQEFVGGATQRTDNIKVGDFVSKEATSFGSAKIKAARKDGAIWVSRDTRRILHGVFEADIRKLQTSEMSLTARHITKIGIVGIAWQQSPEQILWIWLNDGGLASVTYDRLNDVLGWALHDISGGLVKSACIIPGADGKTEDLYLLIERTIGGAAARYIEVMQPFYDIVEGEDAADSWYLDSALRYEGVAADVITGLSHLEGETVTALADGKVVDNLTVASGSVTLPFEASNVLVGLHTSAYIWSLSPDFAVSDGASAGRLRYIRNVAVKALGIGGKVKVVDSSNDHELLAPTGDLTPGEAPEAYSVTKTVPLNSNPEESNRIEILQDQPLPLDLLAFVTNMEVAD